MTRWCKKKWCCKSQEYCFSFPLFVTLETSATDVIQPRWLCCLHHIRHMPITKVVRESDRDTGCRFAVTTTLLVDRPCCSNGTMGTKLYFQFLKTFEWPQVEQAPRGGPCNGCVKELADARQPCSLVPAHDTYLPIMQNDRPSIYCLPRERAAFADHVRLQAPALNNVLQ